jgi:hypothetical protein
MIRAELETRLLEIARDIEAAQTVVFLREHERETLRHALRLAIHAEEASKQ